MRFKWTDSGAVPFRVKRNLNHSPQWYGEHCRGEDAAPSVQAMLLADMEYLGADIDSTLHDCEKIPIYEAKWNKILADHKDPRGADIGRILEKEFLKGFTPSVEYRQEPFKTIDRLMTKHELTEDHIREFLFWRSRQRAVAKRRQKKERSQKADSKRSPLQQWLRSRR